MILQALCEYYDRCSQDPEKALPIMGFEYKEIDFTIVIDIHGNFINLEDNRFNQDEVLKVRAFKVPQSAIRSGSKSYSVANCLWDHFGYVLAQGKPDAKGEDEIAKAQHQADLQFDSFFKQTALVAEQTQDPEVIAVLKFLQNRDNINKVKEHELYKDALKIKGCNFAFRLNSEQHLVCQTVNVQKWVQDHLEEKSDDLIDGVCLITGERGKITRLHNPVSGVTVKPAPLSSINDSAYCSYGKSKAFNFPCSVEAVFKYTSALNKLLQKDSLNRLRLSNMTMVFWSQKQSVLEESMGALFGDFDNPDARIEAIREVYASMHRGFNADTSGDSLFYVLGLSPNVSRIAIRFWITGTVAGFTQKIVEWLNDINIVVSFEHKKDWRFPIIKLVKSLALLNKEDDPKLTELYESLIRAIFSNRKFPVSILKTALIRIKADTNHVTPERAALIKAWLNRFYRITNKDKERVKEMLNTDEKDIGYNLGRLFAVLEKLQKDSSGGNLNSTITDRYYSSASCSPMTVFGTLMRLHSHHLRKLENVGQKVTYEKDIAAIMQNISAFPAHLNLEQQGLFFFFYYHQKQYLYTPKSEKEQN